MAAVSVSADNNRVNAADSTTNWGNDGGGGGVSAENDITYQNQISMSRKVSTSRIGRHYNPGAGAVDMTASKRRHYMAKVTATNPSALLSRTSPAMGVKIGSSSSDYYEYYVAGNDNYPARGGWLLIPISPNVSGYRDGTTGTPSLSGVDYWSLLADFSATSKAENLCIDAIDIGNGLNLIGGDGASTDGLFADFAAFDEGTLTNRQGYCFTQGSLILFNGRVSIGRNTSDSAVATEFTSVGEICFWQNGYAETGFHRLLIDLGSASTVVSLTRDTIGSEGEKNNTVGLGYTSSEDTRLVVEVVGTSGTCDLTDTQFKNLQNMILTSVVTLDGCDVATEALTQSGATIDACTIRTSSVTSVATLQDPDFTAIADTTFVQAGAGHAIEIATAGTYTFDNLTFVGYGADTNDDAAIDVTETTGTVTINYTGSVPTYKTAGATVVLQASITVTFTPLPVGTEVRVYKTSDGSEVDGVESSGSSFAAGLQASVEYRIMVMQAGYEPKKFVETFGGTQNFNPGLLPDGNYLDQ